MAEQFMSLELKRLFLELLFGGREAPSHLWAGLSTQRFDGIAPTLATLSNTEPKDASGYARQPIRRRDWVIRSDPLRVDTLEAPTFRNIGPERWPTVMTWFVATSDTAEGVLIGYGALKEARVLLHLDSLILPVSFAYEPVR